jgi:lipopolysaccharide biosynthesis glycosyltransferase
VDIEISPRAVLRPVFRRVPSPWSRTAAVYTCDRRFLPGLAVSIRSLLTMHPDLPVVVISSDLNAEEVALLENAVTVIEVPAARNASWNRLSLFRLPLQAAVYLDVDVVVARPLDALLEQAQDVGLAAVRDVNGPDHLNKGIVANYTSAEPLHELGIDPARPGLNAGVFAASVERYGSAVDAALRSFERYHRYFVRNGDQSLLNLVAAAGAVPFAWLPGEMNVIVWHASAAELHDARVLHFAGAPKPWESGCAAPAQERFRAWIT